VRNNIASLTKMALTVVKSTMPQVRSITLMSFLRMERLRKSIGESLFL
jgi:hypothetical protein